MQVVEHVFTPDHFFQHRGGDFGFTHGVDGGRVTPVVAHRDAAAVRCGDAVGDALDALLDQVLHAGLEGARSAAQHRLGRNGVDRFAGVEGGHAHHRGIDRADDAAGYGLQCEHQLGADDHRVDAVVRHGGVRATPADADLEVIG